MSQPASGPAPAESVRNAFIHLLYRRHLGADQIATASLLADELTQWTKNLGPPDRHFNSRTIRHLVKAIRDDMLNQPDPRHIHLICAIPGGPKRGYFVARDEAEALQWERSMTLRTVRQWRVLHAMRVARKRKFPRQSPLCAPLYPVSRRYTLARPTVAFPAIVGVQEPIPFEEAS
jgi:hypothetical protein